jgi:cellulose synthase/poly-beta-1,6-N-acetylglucosamine synthase-like glycosyltransferase
MSSLITVLYGTAALTGATFAAVEFRMLWRFLRNRREIRAAVTSAPRSGTRRGERDDGQVLPLVTIQLPLYNERRAAEQIIRAASAQDYPRDRFDVQVLDDSNDETVDIVARVVDQVRADGVRIEHVQRGSRTGYKAGALAEGLARSEAEFVAVFDADFIPDPSFLRTVLIDRQGFDEADIAFVQTRWAWSEPIRGFLASSLALLLDRHFFLQKPTRAFIGNVATFNGSGGIWRRAAIDQAGGWSAETLTEDLDLSYRCALSGWRGRYLRDVPVVNELPEDMRAFKQQQHRWAKGNAQCFRILTARVLSARGVLKDRVDEAFLLAGYAIHPILLTNLLLWPLAVLYMDRTVFWIVQGFMALVIVVAPVSFALTVIERDTRLSIRAISQIVSSVCVGIGLMVNNTIGQIQGFLSSGGEFVRTPKAFHASSESVPDQATPDAYLVPLHWSFFVELLVIVYCLVSTGVLIQAGEGFWAVPMAFWAFCLGIVAQQQLTPAAA